MRKTLFPRAFGRLREFSEFSEKTLCNGGIAGYSGGVRGRAHCRVCLGQIETSRSVLLNHLGFMPRATGARFYSRIANAALLAWYSSLLCEYPLGPVLMNRLKTTLIDHTTKKYYRRESEGAENQ